VEKGGAAALLCGTRVPNQDSPSGYIVEGYVAHFIATGPVGTTLIEISLGSVSAPGWTGRDVEFPVRAASDPPSAVVIVTNNIGFDSSTKVDLELMYGGRIVDFSFNLVC
jgi:hypothetical protein